MEVNISATAFRLARQFSGLSQSQISSITGLRQADVSLIERGLYSSNLNQEIVDKLACAMGFAPSFLTGSARIRDPIQPMQRSAKSKVLASETNAAIALANLIRFHVETIVSDFVDISVELPDVAESPGIYPREVARALRTAWDLSNEPIENLTAECERRGILVYSSLLPSASIDGFTLEVDQTGQPIIFLNSAAPADRARLSLAHELGHIVLGHESVRAGDPVLEEEAWEFAGEFMAPADALRSDVRALRKISLSTLLALKRKWRLSMQALAHRLRKLSVLTDSQYKSIYVQMSRAGYRRNEPGPIPPEQESLFSKVFDMLKQELGMTTTEIVQVFGLTESTFFDLYGKYWGGGESRLRLVR